MCQRAGVREVPRSITSRRKRTWSRTPWITSLVVASKSCVDDRSRRTAHQPGGGHFGIWSAFEGPLFIAATELWVAARLDADLRNRLRPIEREIGHLIHQLATEIFPEEIVSRPDFYRALDAVVNVIPGLAITAVVPEGRLQPSRVVEVAMQVLLSTPIHRNNKRRQGGQSDHQLTTSSRRRWPRAATGPTCSAIGWRCDLTAGRCPT